MFERAGAWLCVCALALSGAARAAAATTSPSGTPRASAPHAQTVGRLADPRLREISGLAASPHHNGRYWVHNDSGDGPYLYAIDARGALEGTLQIDGVVAVDWEDIAAFERDGKSYLLVADSGDNLGLRGEYTLIAVEEPELPQDGTPVHVRPAWQVRYRYTDAAHDTEAMAVEARDDSVLLLPKFVEPLQVFRVPLQPGNDEVQIAEPWAVLTEPEPSAAKGAPKFRATGLALDVERHYAAVLGYRSVRLYERRPDEDSHHAFSHTPQRITVAPPLHQPEAIGFSRDGSTLFVTGEGLGQPLLRLEMPSR